MQESPEERKRKRLPQSLPSPVWMAIFTTEPGGGPPGGGLAIEMLQLDT